MQPWKEANKSRVQATLINSFEYPRVYAHVKEAETLPEGDLTNHIESIALEPVAQVEDWRGELVRSEFVQPLGEQSGTVINIGLIGHQGRHVVRGGEFTTLCSVMSVVQIREQGGMVLIWCPRCIPSAL